MGIMGHAAYGSYFSTIWKTAEYTVGFLEELVCCDHRAAMLKHYPALNVCSATSCRAPERSTSCSGQSRIEEDPTASCCGATNLSAPGEGYRKADCALHLHRKGRVRDARSSVGRRAESRLSGRSVGAASHHHPRASAIDVLTQHRHRTQQRNSYETLDELTQLLFIFEHFDEIIGPEENDLFLGQVGRRGTDRYRRAQSYFDKLTEELVDPSARLSASPPSLHARHRPRSMRT